MHQTSWNIITCQKLQSYKKKCAGNLDFYNCNKNEKRDFCRSTLLRIYSGSVVESFPVFDVIYSICSAEFIPQWMKNWHKNKAWKKNIFQTQFKIGIRGEGGVLYVWDVLSNFHSILTIRKMGRTSCTYRSKIILKTEYIEDQEL